MFKESLICLVFFVLHIHALTEQSIFGKHQLIAYVVDWDVPKVIPWDKLDHIAYAFAVPDQKGDLKQFDPEQLEAIVESAHNHEKGVSLAIGGWTGSIHFSKLVRNEASRQRFATKLVNIVDKYSLNGLNVDWEYPNDPDGISCNIKHPKDTENFLKLIKLLREMMDEKYPDEHKLITAAVSARVFKDEDRHTIQNLDEGWSKYMDAFYVMAYDINGVYSKVGAANAPLRYGGTGLKVSAEASVQQWIDAGIPAEQIYLGVPFYGYTQKTLKDITVESGMDVPLDRSISQIKGDKYDDFFADPCPGAKKTFSGEYQWRTLKAAGAIHNSSEWLTLWDHKSQTPFSYSHKKRQFVTFDSPKSLKLKSEFAQEKGLGGIMLWSLEMDDTGNSLLKALQDVRT